MPFLIFLSVAATAQIPLKHVRNPEKSLSPPVFVRATTCRKRAGDKK